VVGTDGLGVLLRAGLSRVARSSGATDGQPHGGSIGSLREARAQRLREQANFDLLRRIRRRQFDIGQRQCSSLQRSNSKRRLKALSKRFSR
jgi:hypothetical protein